MAKNKMSDVLLSDRIARMREKKQDYSKEAKEMEYRLYEQGHTARGTPRPKPTEDATGAGARKMKLQKYLLENKEKY